MNTDNIDRFGHCVSCHKNLLTKRVVDGKIVDMFMPIYSDTTFLLSDGSQMQVTICKPCKESIDLNCPNKHEDIMEACVKGWKLETEICKEESWSMEDRNKYLEKVSSLNIDCNSENLDKYVIQNRSIELMKLTVEDIPEVIQ